MEDFKKELLKGLREACIRHNLDPQKPVTFKREGTIEEIVEEIVAYLPQKQKRPIGFYREENEE